MNKMAGWFSRFSWLSHEGYTQICVARGNVSWGSKNDAAGELQLWYRESDNSYYINARKRMSDEILVCKVIFSSCLDTRQPGTAFKKLDTRQSEILINFLQIARLIPLRT